MRANNVTNKIIKIGLVEIGDSFGEQYYFPYSIGILWAYAEKLLSPEGNYQLLPIIYKRGDVNNYASILSDAHIIFYSTYLWNINISLAVAQETKRINPDIINVFGGPSIPESSEKMAAFLNRYSYVDIASFGAGEMPFIRMIERWNDKGWDAVPSIGWRRPDNSIGFNCFSETIEDINDIPSPYLMGVFDELILQNPDEKWQGRIETNRGCPFTCAFCYWGKKSDGRIKQFELGRIFSEIDWLSKNKIEFVFCCDANFGILKRDLEIARKVADNKKSIGFPKAFSVQNTKNAKERIFELQQILNIEGLQKGVNLALQSLNPDTLKHIARSNIDNMTFIELQKLFTKNNIPTFSDLIIGLPEETYDSFITGVSDLIASGQHNRIQFINLTILENTLMADKEYQRRYDLKIVEAEFMPHHSSLDINKEIKETHLLVIGTSTMPENDWVKTKVFSWMVSLLHFDKLLQIPFIILHDIYNISYKDLFELFLQKESQVSIISNIVTAFYEKALHIQNGGIEYCESDKWLNITWVPDELAFIDLSANGNLQNFYIEAEKRLIVFTNTYKMIPVDLISQAILLNQNLIKQPNINNDKVIQCDFNLWEVYQESIKGNNVGINKGRYLYTIDRTSQSWNNWETWCREVIWYGSKRGDYIYSVKSN